MCFFLMCLRPTRSTRTVTLFPDTTRVRSGIYTWLPLGDRVLRSVERIVREEMDAIGAQEVHFPALLPKEPYEATGRWTEYGEGVFRLHDRKGADRKSTRLTSSH